MKKFLCVALLGLCLPLVACATVTSQVDKSGPYLITSLPMALPSGFPFVSGSELLVLDTGPTSAPYDPAHVLDGASDYTTTGGNYNTANQMQAGTVTVVGTGASSVAVNDYIVIMRKVPINQTSSFTSTGPNTVLLLEQMGDKLATLSQQVNEISQRSLQFENWEFLSGTLLKSARSGSLLGFDANGNIAYVPNAGTSGVFPTLTVTGLVSFNQATAVNPTPAANTILHITAKDATQGVVSIDTFGVSGAPIIMGRRAGGTSAIPSGVLSGTALLAFTGNGYGSTGYSAANGFLAYIASENWTNSAQGTFISFATTASGTTTQSTVLTLDQDKTVIVAGDFSAPAITAVATSNLVKTADTLLAPIPGMSITVTVGKTYFFRASILMSTTTTGGFRTVLDGTAVMTNIRVQDTMSYGQAAGVAEVSTSTIGGLGGGNTRPSTGTASTGLSEMTGTFTVATGGTVFITAAQNNGAGATTFYGGPGSHMEAQAR